MDSANTPCERSFPIVKSKRNIRNLIEGLSLTFKLDQDYQYSSAGTIYDRNGFPVSSGAGKGPYHKVGCTFEAFEHYILEMCVSFTRQKICSTQYLLEQNRVLRDNFIAQLVDVNSGELLCNEYEEVSTSRKVYIPVLLNNPKYIGDFDSVSEASLFLSKYSTNSGTASGSTLEEAILHGANEQIERHYVSLYYMHLIGLLQTNVFRKYDIEKIIKDNSELYNAVESINYEIEVVCAINHVGSYFFFCYLQCDKYKLRLRGSAVSFDEFHALERSIYELIQAANLYDESCALEDEAALKTMREYKSLEAIRDPNSKSFEMWCSNEVSKFSGNHFDALMASLKRANQNIYFCTLFNSNDIYVVSVHIPGLERFNLIDKGTLVTPLGDY